MKKTGSLIAAIFALASLASIVRADTAVVPATPASATTPAAKGTWAKEHPRRHEVNHRERKQVKNTNKAVKSGKITAAQGQQLNKEDRQVRQEEHDMASQNNGHITKQEQQTLNSQENAIRKQRAADIKSDASQPAAAQ